MYYFTKHDIINISTDYSLLKFWQNKLQAISSLKVFIVSIGSKYYRSFIPALEIAVFT